MLVNVNVYKVPEFCTVSPTISGRCSQLFESCSVAIRSKYFPSGDWLIDRAPVYERVAIIPILLTAELVTNFHTEHHYHSCMLKRVKGQGRSTQFSIQQSL